MSKGTASLILFKTVALNFGIALLAITVLLVLLPQILFKCAERTLTVGPEGWSTQIGKLSGSRRWADVVSIQDGMNLIIITGKNGNALIVPNRAFPDLASRRQFLADVRYWHSGHYG